MTTRITPTHAINGLKQREFPLKNSPHSRKTKRTTTKQRTKKIVKEAKEDYDSLKDIKMSLRQECIRLASFLKQETHRPGFVR